MHIKIIKEKFKDKFIVNIDVENEDSDYAILTIVCYDAPFIIDSVNNELQTHDIDINLLTHKVIDQKNYGDYKFTHLKKIKLLHYNFIFLTGLIVIFTNHWKQRL